jgi:hypothetical protein
MVLGRSGDRLKNSAFIALCDKCIRVALAVRALEHTIRCRKILEERLCGSGRILPTGRSGYAIGNNRSISLLSPALAPSAVVRCLRNRPSIASVPIDSKKQISGTRDAREFAC